MSDKQVVVYGASDDLIEVEGVVTEEFSATDINLGDGEATGRILAFSDGTVLEVLYGQGTEAFWRIRRLAIGTAKYELVEADDEETNYSDRATLTGDDLKWVIGGDMWAKAKKAKA